MDEGDLVLRVSEVAALLRLSKGATYQAVREGIIPSIRVNRRILIPRAALERMLAEAGKELPDEG